MGFFPFVTTPPALAEPPWLPADVGYLAWTYDPALAVNNLALAVGGTLNLFRIQVRSPITCTNVVLDVATGGTTLTAGENFAGLYSSSGTLIGTSADQTTNWATPGLYVTPLTGGPFALLAGYYWVAAMCNSTGTGVALARAASTGALINAGTTGATLRYATNGTGIALPASITPASNAGLAASYWAALS